MKRKDKIVLLIYFIEAIAVIVLVFFFSANPNDSRKPATFALLFLFVPIVYNVAKIFIKRRRRQN